VRDGVWIFGLAAAMIIVTSYFIGFDSFVRPFIDWVGSAQSADAGWITNAKNHAKEMNINFYLVLFSALTIAAVGLVDRLISRYKQHKPMTFMI
jgi:hypothetical protein